MENPACLSMVFPAKNLQYSDYSTLGVLTVYKSQGPVLIRGGLNHVRQIWSLLCSAHQGHLAQRSWRANLAKMSPEEILPRALF